MAQPYLVERIEDCVVALPATEDQRALRELFLKRYKNEMDAWKTRRNDYRRGATVLDMSVAALGVISSAVAAANQGRHSSVLTVAVVVIGIAIALLTTLYRAVDFRGTAASYRRDEFQLRSFGWRYLRELDEGIPREQAYSTFQGAVSELLVQFHPMPFASQTV